MSMVWGNSWESLTSPTTAVVDALPFVADAAVKGAIVFALAAVAVVLLRRRSAATRHAIWAGAVAAQLGIPVLAALLPAWRVPLLPSMSRRLSESHFRLEYTPPDAAPATLEVTIPRAASMLRAGRRFRTVVPRARVATGGWDISTSRGSGDGHGIGVGYAGPGTEIYIMAGDGEPGGDSGRWLRVVAIVWLLGSLAILGRFLAGTLAVWRLARRSQRVDDGRWLSLAQRVSIALGVARPLTLLRSRRFGIPVTWGVVYPVVLLPDDADEWSEERRQYVMVHEMAHVKRIDAFTQLVAQFALALFWFDPLVWIAVHRMRVEREHACDDYVLRHGTSPSTYASDLLEMVRSLGGDRPTAQPAFASLAMARPAELEERMLAILDPHHDRRPLRNAPAVALSALALACLAPLAALNPFGTRHSSFPGFHSPPIPVVPARAWSEPDYAAAVIAADAGARVGAAMAATAATAARAAVAAATASVHATTAAMAPVVAATTSVGTSSCSMVSRRRESRGRGTSSTSTSIHIDDDGPDGANFQYMSSNPTRCLHVTVSGVVTFSPDEREVQSLSRGGRLYVRERLGDADREVTITRGAGAAIEYEFVRDGESAPFDDSAREWLSALIPEILRESGLNSKARVARIRRQGGVGAVLAEISQTSSASAKRATYEALLDQGELTEDELDRVVEQAGRDLSSSDSELRALLSRISFRGRPSSRASTAAVEAAGRMSSDGEKRAVLQQYALGADRQTLIAAMREVRKMSSDGEKSELLRTVASRYLSADDEALRTAYFSAVETFTSDGERASVLQAAVPYASASPKVVLSILDATRPMSSDGEKAEVLVTLARQHLISAAGVREAFMKAARSLGSDAEYRRVMEVALQ